MQAIIAHLPIDPTKTIEYEAQFAANAALVYKSEPGCLLYQLSKDKKNPGSYTVLELYQDKTALKTHFKNMSQRPKGQPNYLTGKPTLIIMPVMGTPVFRKSVIANNGSSIAVVAKMSCKPNSSSKMLASYSPAAQGVQDQEPGTHLYAFGEDPKNLGSFYFMELYQDMKSVGKHSKMSHFKTMMKAQGPLMAGKPVIQIRTPVGKSHAKL